MLLSLHIWHMGFDVKSIPFSHTLIFKIISALVIDTAVVLCVTYITDIRGVLTVIRFLFFFVLHLELKEFYWLWLLFSVFTYHCGLTYIVKIHLSGSLVPHVNSSRILWWLFMFLCPPQLEPLSSLNFPS